MCAKPPDTMKIARMSDIYFASEQVAEVASRSLTELFGVDVAGSKPSGIGTTSALSVQVASHNDDSGSSSKPSATVETQKVTADSVNYVTVGQDSEMKDASPPQEENVLASTRMLRRMLAHLIVKKLESLEVAPQHLVNFLEVAPQHLVNPLQAVPQRGVDENSGSVSEPSKVSTDKPAASPVDQKPKEDKTIWTKGYSQHCLARHPR